MKILDCLGKYVPSIENIEYEDEDELKVHHFHHILLGGDQVTVARVRGAQRMRQNSESGQRCLQGFIPVIEDWHAKVVLCMHYHTTVYILQEFCTSYLPGNLDQVVFKGH